MEGWDGYGVREGVLDAVSALGALLLLVTASTASYAFRRLAENGRLDWELAERLVRAAGFRNVVAHAYEQLDMARVYSAARHGPADLRAFLAALAQSSLAR